MSKNTMFCPHCGGELFKEINDGLGVRRCKVCSASWFIVLCRRPTEGEVEIDDKEKDAI